MATHSSILAWGISRTEEPGGVQSTGSQSQTWLSDETRASCTLKSSVILGRLVAQAPYLKPDTACQRQVVLILCFPFIASQPGFFLAGPES